MTRTETFVFRVSEDERQLIKTLAYQLNRTESDAVRYVVREKALELARIMPAPVNRVRSANPG